MDQLLQASISGLATAAILAVAATGLVLTYTTTGIFNFAHGALGMIGAFTYWQLRVDWEWPAPIALLVVLGVLAPLVGAAIEVGIMRGLTDAPEAARVVVTISLLLALLGVGLWVWSPTQAHPVQPFWGNGASVEVAGVTLTYHAITAFVVAALLALGLRLLLFNTRPGLAMRAAVDDRPLSVLNGAHPARSAMLAWAIGVTCAALSGILMAPTTRLDHVPLTLLIVNAYAAAMIGRLRSLPMTFLGAVLLGLADAYVIAYAPSSVFWSRFRYALPAIALFTVLMVLRPVPLTRSRVLGRTREIVPRPGWGGSLLAAAAFVGAGAYLAATLGDSTDLLQVSRIVALAIIGLSLVPLVGFGGQLSLCQMSFAGIGAVVMAHHGHGGDPLGLVYAAVLAGAVGAVVAVPAIRLGGLYFALATAAFAAVLDQWVFRLSELDVGPWTLRFFPGGTAPVDRLDAPGVGGPRSLLVAMAIVFALLYLLVVAIRRSSFGHRLLAMKESPAASATIGMNLVATKFAVFTLSAAMAGVGGALYAGAVTGSVSPEQFSFVTSLPLLLLAVVGGIGSAAGALFAGILLGGMPMVVEAWPWFENISEVLPGLMGIALGRNPNGAMLEIRGSFAPLKRNRAAAGLTAATTAVVLGLRIADLLGGVPYVVALLAAAVSGLVLLRLTGAVPVAPAEPLAVPAAGTTGAGPGPAVAASAGAAGEPGTAVPDARGDLGGPVPVEWVGIDRPFTADDAVALERALGVDIGTPPPAAVPAGGSGRRGAAGGDPPADPHPEAREEIR